MAPNPVPPTQQNQDRMYPNPTSGHTLPLWTTNMCETLPSLIVGNHDANTSEPTLAKSYNLGVSFRIQV